MATFIMIGKYSPEAVKDISSNRTEKTVGLVRELGGKIVAMYALLGDQDFVLIVEFSDTKTAMKASLCLSMLTGISFSSYPAVSVDDFDRMLGAV